MIRRALIAVCVAIAAFGIVGGVLALAPVAAPQVMPDHFAITEYADIRSLSDPGTNPYPTSVSVGPDGRVYVALEGGRIFAFEDLDGDDQSDRSQLFARTQYSPIRTEIDLPKDTAWANGVLYVVVPEMIWVLRDDTGDGDARDEGDHSKSFTHGLPNYVRGIAFDQTGDVYVSAAAGCNSCQPLDPYRGSVIHITRGGTDTTLYTWPSLHDPYDLDFYPETNDLFAPDDGRDDLGSGAPPDEWNFIQHQGHYGWPHCWEGGSDPGWGAFCASLTTGPIATFPAHSFPAGMTFHDGTAIPSRFANNAFVAVRNLDAVYRVVMTPDGMGGYTASTEPFATGFNDPIDVAVGPEGELYVVEHYGRKVYCIRATPDLSESWKGVTPRFPDTSGIPLTYTLYVVASGPGSPFNLTDSIPLSTTYVPGSVWASAGTIAETGGVITWDGVVDANTTLTATFVAQIPASVPTRTAIINSATLTGTEDTDSPYTLLAVAIIQPYHWYFPLFLQSP